MILAVVFISVCITLLAIFLGNLLGPGGALENRRRLKKRINPPGTFQQEDLKGAKPQSIRKQYNLSQIQVVQKIFAHHASTEAIAALLKTAKIGVSVSFFFSTSLAIGIFSYLIMYQQHVATSPALLISLLLTVLPFTYLKMVRKNYLAKFESYLPDTLGIMANVIKVGHGLESALENVVKSAPYPVNEEFKTVRAEMKLGISLSKALDNLYARIGGSELKILVTGIAIHQELGGNLSEILDNLQETIRERFALAREIKALSAQGIMSAAVMYCLPILIGIGWTMKEPVLMKNFFASEVGKIAIWFMVANQILAFFLIRKVINIKD